MPSIGDLTLKIAADFSEATSKLADLKTNITSTLTAPDTSSLTAALSGITSEVDKLEQTLTGLSLSLPQLDTSGFLGGIGTASDAIRGLEQEITQALGSIQISPPSGSIVAGSAAADIAQEIAQAVESTQINLNIAPVEGSAAANIAAEIQQEIAANPITVPITPDLIGGGAVDTAGVEFTAPDTSTITDALQQIDTVAQQTVDAVNQDFAGEAIPAIDTSAADQSLQSIDDAATQAMDQLNSDLAGTAVPALDTSAPEASLSGLDDAAQTAMDTLAQDVSGVAVPPLDVTQAEDSLTGLDTAAQTAMDAVSQDVAGIAVPAIDTTAADDSLNALEQTAQSDLAQMEEYFAGAGFPPLDVAPIEQSLASLEESASGLGPSLGEVADGINSDATAANAGQSALQDLIDKFREGEISVREYIDGANALAAALEATGQQATEMGGAFGNAQDGMSQFSLGAQQIIGDQQSADEALAQAQSVLAELQQAYDAGAISEDTLARAAQQLQSAFDDANPALQESGKDAEDAGNSFEQMAEKMTALGEALVITEGLKELGSEALAAGDALTHAQIALTNITGSAEEAETTIKGLEQIAASDALAMPQLLTAATRMQQMLPPGTDVVNLLGSIANGAAIMGTSIDAAATKFDTLVNQGTASARSLTSLGLSLSTLADALNAVNPDLNATADTAAKMFKALDPGDRITVLQTALGNLGNVAQQVAEQTFGGQWQALANQWEAIMAQIGQALTPALGALTSFSKDILGIVGPLVDLFRELPAPIQEFAGGIAIAAAAVVPLAGGIAATSLAISGLSTVFEAASGAASAFFGLFAEAEATETAAVVATTALVTAEEAEAASAESAATAEGALAAARGTATEAAGAEAAASTAAAGGAEAMGVSLGGAALAAGVLVGGVLALGEGLQLLQDKLTAIGTGAEKASQDWFNMNSALGGLAPSMESVDTNVDHFKLSISDADGASTQLESTVNMVHAQLGDLGQAFLVAGTDAQTASAQVQSFDDDLQKFLTHQSDLGSKLATAKSNLDLLTQAYKDGSAVNQSGYVPSLQDVENAQRAVDSATTTLYGHQQTLKDQTIALAQATHDFSDIVQNISLNTLGDQTRNTASDFDALTQRVSDLRTSVDLAQQRLNNAVQALEDLKAQADGSAASMDAITAASNRVQSAYNALLDTTKNLNAAQDALNSSFAKIGTGAADDAITRLTNDTIAAGDKIKDLGVDLDGLTSKAPAISPLNQAFIDLGNNAKQAKPDLEQLLADIKALENDPGTGWDEMTGKIGKFDSAIAQIAKTDLPDATHAYGQFVSSLQDSDAPLSVVATALQTYQGYINKLAKIDLPDAIDEQDNYIARLERMNAPLSEIQDATLKWDQMQIKLAEDSGTSADIYVGNIEKIKLQQDAAALSAHGWADAQNKAINDALDGFNKLADAMGQAIVQGKNVGDALIKAFQGIAASILSDLIKGALSPLKASLEDLIQKTFPDINTGIGTVSKSTTALSSSFDAASTSATGIAAAQNAAVAATTAETTATAAETGAEVTDTAATVSDASATVAETASTIAQTTADIAETAATIADTVAQIAFTSVVSAVAGVIGAIAGIIGDVYLAAIDTKLFHVETSLLEIRNETQNRRADAWDQFNQTYDRLGEVLNRLNTIMDNTSKIADSGLGGISQSGQDNLTHMDDSLSVIKGDTDAMVGNGNDQLTMERQIDNDIVDGNSQLYDEMAVINTSVEAVVTALTYGNGANKQNSQDLANSFAQADAMMAAQIGGGLGGVISGVGEQVNQTLQQQLAVDQHNVELGAELAATAKTESDTLAGLHMELVGLRQEEADYSAAANAALAAGNADLAAEYTASANQIASQINSVNLQISSTEEGFNTRNANAIINGIGESANGLTTAFSSGTTTILSGLNSVSGTVASGSSAIVAAVNSSAAAIAQAVFASGANAPSGSSTAGAGGGAGSTTFIPPAHGGGTANAPPPGSGNVPTAPGVGGNTNTTGAFSPPVPPSTPPPAGNPPQYYPLGGDPTRPGSSTPIQPGGGGNINNAIPGAPPFGGATIPQFQTGGFVDVSGLAIAEKGEAVLTPGQTYALTSLAQILSGPGPAAGAATSQALLEAQAALVQHQLEVLQAQQVSQQAAALAAQQQGQQQIAASQAQLATMVSQDQAAHEALEQARVAQQLGEEHIQNAQDQLDVERANGTISEAQLQAQERLLVAQQTMLEQQVQAKQQAADQADLALNMAQRQLDVLMQQLLQQQEAAQQQQDQLSQQVDLAKAQLAAILAQEQAAKSENLDISNLPHFATGGMVDASGLAFADKGEGVLTVDQTNAISAFAQALTGASSAPPTPTSGYGSLTPDTKQANIDSLTSQLAMLIQEWQTAQTFGAGTVEVQELLNQIQAVQKQLDALNGVTQQQSTQQQGAANQANNNAQQATGLSAQMLALIEGFVPAANANSNAQIAAINLSGTQIAAAVGGTSLSPPAGFPGGGPRPPIPPLGGPGIDTSMPAAQPPPVNPFNLGYFSGGYGFDQYFQGGPLNGGPINAIDLAMQPTVAGSGGPRALGAPIPNNTSQIPPQIMPSFDLGGFNTADQLAMLHAGEWIIPPAPGTIALPWEVISRISPADLRAGGTIPSGYGVGSAAGVGAAGTLLAGASTVNNGGTFGPFNFYGVTSPAQMADSLMGELRRRGVGRTANS